MIMGFKKKKREEGRDDDEEKREKKKKNGCRYTNLEELVYAMNARKFG